MLSVQQSIVKRAAAGIAGGCLAFLMLAITVSNAQDSKPQTGLHYFAIEQLEPGSTSGDIVRRGTAGSNGIAYSNLILAPNTT